jgi:hypothetical protein
MLSLKIQSIHFLAALDPQYFRSASDTVKFRSLLVDECHHSPPLNPEHELLIWVLVPKKICFHYPHLPQNVACKVSLQFEGSSSKSYLHVVSRSTVEPAEGIFNFSLTCLFDLPLYRTPVFRTRLAYRTEDGGNKHL